MTLLVFVILWRLLSVDAAQDGPEKLPQDEPDLIHMALEAGERLGVAPNPFSDGAFPIGEEQVKASRFVPLSGVVLDEESVVKVGGPENAIGELFHSKDRTALYYRVGPKLYSIVVPSQSDNHKTAWLHKIDRSQTRAAFTMKMDRWDSYLLCLVDLENQKVQTAIYCIANERSESEFEQQLFQFIAPFLPLRSGVD